MNKDDQVLLKDPEISLAESLDNSIKNITGIKDKMSDSKEVIINNASETPNVNIRTDSKDTATSSVSTKAENSKSDLVADSGIVSNTIPKTGNPIKLPGKPISGTIAKDRITGQYILIQPGGGPGVPVRLAANSGNTAKQVAVQVIRKSDGTLVPIKPNKQIHLNNVNLTGKKIITGTSGPTILLNKSASITNSINTTSTSLIKATISPSSAGSLQNKPTMTTVTISGNKTKYLNSSSIVNIGNKIVVKGDNKRPLDDSSSSLQKLSSQKFIKLSPSTTGSGNVQTLQLSGKPGGVQYVRLLNAGVGKETLSPTKVIVKNQDGHIRMVTKVNQQPLLDGKTIIVKDSSNKIVQEQLGQQKFTTIPMLRKINDSSLISATNNKIITVRKEDVEQLNAKLKQKNLASTSSVTLGANIVPKPRILNNLGRLTGNLSISSSSNSLSNPQHRQQFLTKKDQITAGTSSLTTLNKATVSNIKISPKKFVQIGGSQTIVRNFEAPQKLYSVLKPSTQVTEQKVPNVSTTNTATKLASSLRKSFSGQRTRSPSPNTDGGLRRKHCNCTKSQCLKLYCDCFANGEFCQDCNCKECFNNLEYEDERQKAIRMCLERNPAAFKPKITKARDQNDLRLHNKGCNCKRSGCLKNYCECYEAKIVCSSNCKCVGCRNIEDRGPNLNITDMSKIPKSYNRGIAIKRSFDDIGGHSSGKIQNSKIKNEIDGDDEDSVSNDVNVSSLNQSGQSKPAYNFITQDVVDATIQCMIAQADECQKGALSTKTTERMILEELGRCLVEIIDFSIKNLDE